MHALFRIDVTTWRIGQDEPILIDDRGTLKNTKFISL